MTKSSIAVMCVVCACLWSIPPALAQDLGTTQSAPETEHRWVGFTTTITDGSIEAQSGALQGYSAMNSFCALEVAPNARVCTTSDIVRSVVEGRRDARGWVMPTGQVLQYDPSASEFADWFAVDTATGLAGPSVAVPFDANRQLSCGGFLDNGATGIVANSSGFLQTSCGSRYAIACCAPVPVDVTPSP